MGGGTRREWEERRGRRGIGGEGGDKEVKGKMKEERKGKIA